ncbi:hypothetical protein CEN44_13775 [Fischerella muscicola CCMEE 5323]|uniref:DUF4384 domain-containing protein n=2 Tax=Hapalosiphonaceae TaxID=1892263 RepID=A0A2N6K2A6_FISMU|nr:hypothetical protein [Fischerella sp. FACHB-380]PLZ89147.1 hypothetical protein CEN44_13775 [Fischerella muscicola CCMEE 5323]
MPSLEKEYLEYVSEQIFPGNVRPELQYGTFIGRFNTNNYSLKSTEIAQGLTQMQGKDYASGINQHIKEVIEKIYRGFRDELAQDGITEQQLGLGNQKGNPGRKTSDIKSPWQIAYEWLWDIKYSRWLQDYIWENWKQRAQTNVEWIQFCDRSVEYASKGMKIPQALPKEIIPINTPLSLKINLDNPGSYLLLFNRGLDAQGNTTKYLVTPSQAFAPSYQLMEKSTLIPLQNAMCEDIQFDSVGKEEYIGIVIDKALNLPWLNPNPENPVLEWQGKHLEQVWEQLHAQDNWRVFYRDFNVVSVNL